LDEAKRLAGAAGFERIAVISAIGTREYYARHGFELDGLYMTSRLRPDDGVTSPAA
jgi:elongator complex protein 3